MQVPTTNFQVDDQVISSGSHMVADFIPNPVIGSAVKLFAANIDRNTAQKALIETFRTAIAERLHVPEAMLEGEDAITLVSAHVSELPPSIQNEWNKMDDLSGKITTFLASGWAQVMGGGLVGSLAGSFLFPPLGTIVGLVGGIGAGYGASLLMKDVVGDLDELTCTEAAIAIHKAAAQAQSKGLPATIDKTLLGAYLIAAHSGPDQLLQGYNSEKLKRMFTEHMTARAEGNMEQTDLDRYIARLNMADDNPFARLLPKNIDHEKIKSGVLETIAQNMHEQKDLENWMFNSKLAQDQLAAPAYHTASLDMQNVRQAGGQLYNAIGAETVPYAPPARSGKDLLGLS